MVSASFCIWLYMGWVHVRFFDAMAIRCSLPSLYRWKRTAPKPTCDALYEIPMGWELLKRCLFFYAPLPWNLFLGEVMKWFRGCSQVGQKVRGGFRGGGGGGGGGGG